MHEAACRALIADDEANARALIREYLADYPAIEIVGECANGPQVVEAVARQAVDLIFLDIEMPGCDGFQVLEKLEDPPRIIFSTAYDRYAVKAFEVMALDYLLKPYDRRRFADAMTKLRADIPKPKGDEAALVRDRLLVRDRHRIVPVRLETILWVEAADDYSMIHTKNGAILCSRGLGDLAERLPGDRFMRVHRSAIINMDHLDSLEKDGQGGMIAHLRGGASVRISRTFAAELRRAIL